MKKYKYNGHSVPGMYQNGGGDGMLQKGKKLKEGKGFQTKEEAEKFKKDKTRPSLLSRIKKYFGFKHGGSVGRNGIL